MRKQWPLSLLGESALSLCQKGYNLATFGEKLYATQRKRQLKVCIVAIRVKRYYDV